MQLRGLNAISLIQTLKQNFNLNMTHFYNSIQGWFTFPNFYRELARQGRDNFHYVEVGTWKGKSAAYLAVEIFNSKKQIKFDCVDTWEGSEEHTDSSSPFFEPLLLEKDGLYNHFLQNIAPVRNIINNIHRLPSLSASCLYSDNTLDCVFIDAAHDYQSVCNDINSWLPKLRRGGILAGHDISYQPIREALKDTLISDYTDIGEDVWLYKKR